MHDGTDGGRLGALSVDLDDAWCYLSSHGAADGDGAPSYLDRVVPRMLDLLATRGLTATFFVVGRDAAMARHRATLEAIAKAGHEIGSHGFAHAPWLADASAERVESEIAAAEQAIEAVTGRRPHGFRGPGFTWSKALLTTLGRRGYRYDATVCGNALAPLLRFRYLRRLSREARRRRERLFGGWRDLVLPVGPYRWTSPAGRLLEIPVTSLPVLRLPMHFSYLMAVAERSVPAALAYFRFAMAACRGAGVRPSLLLHPTEFLDDQDVPPLAFLPGMRMPVTRKREVLETMIDHVLEAHRLGPLEAVAAAVEAHDLPLRALA